VDITTISIIVFAAITLVVAAVGMWVRDLFFAGAGGSGTVSMPRRLRRIPNVFDAAPAKDLTGKFDQSFERMVLESGIQMSVSEFFLTIMLSAILLGGGLGLFQEDPLLAVLGGLVGMMIPLGIVSIMRVRRMRAIRAELPVVLDMLARSTRAGKSVDQAIELCATELSGPLAAEFRQCARQLEMGRSFEGVLTSLAARVRIVEMQLLATTLIVQRGSGGSLSETLERMSGVVRDRMMAYRQMMAATGAGRVSTMMVATIGPLAYLFLMLVHRAHLQVMFDDYLGRMMLLLALLLEISGLAWIFKLLREED
jgi:tight adherence protein B